MAQPLATVIISVWGAVLSRGVPRRVHCCERRLTLLPLCPPGGASNAPHPSREKAGSISSETIGVDESTSSSQAGWVKRGDEVRYVR